MPIRKALTMGQIEMTGAWDAKEPGTRVVRLCSCVKLRARLMPRLTHTSEHKKQVQKFVQPHKCIIILGTRPRGWAEAAHCLYYRSFWGISS